jgi:hypothetical protein
VVLMPSKGKAVKIQDLLTNFVWVKAVLKVCANRVPSAWYLADVFRRACYTGAFIELQIIMRNKTYRIL